MRKDSGKDIESLSDEQLGLMFKPIPRTERNWAESRQQVGLIIIGLPALALAIWLLFT
jgi:hypothetical protein